MLPFTILEQRGEQRMWFARASCCEKEFLGYLSYPTLQGPFTPFPLP